MAALTTGGTHAAPAVFPAIVGMAIHGIFREKGASVTKMTQATGARESGGVRAKTRVRVAAGAATRMSAREVAHVAGLLGAASLDEKDGLQAAPDWRSLGSSRGQ